MVMVDLFQYIKKRPASILLGRGSPHSKYVREFGEPVNSQFKACRIQPVGSCCFSTAFLHQT